MVMQSETEITPGNIKLADMAPEWLAGGTDLMERRRHGLSRGPIKALPHDARLGAITWRADGGATIGAGVTIATLAADARLVAAYPGLTAAAAGLATPEIRHVATLGGNIAQRSRCWYYRRPDIACLKKGGSTCPARAGNHLYGVAFDLGPCVAPHPSTMAAALLAYDARITTTLREKVTLSAILGNGNDGTRDHQLGPDEVIAEIELLSPLPGERGLYKRAIGRAEAEWPLVELVTCLWIENGVLRQARIAAGGVASVPIRLTAAEAALTGTQLSALPVAEARRQVAVGAKPLPMTAYKLELLGGLLADALETLGQL
jgi:xanthine dehydrogenase YagS FAD-binding subunit